MIIRKPYAFLIKNFKLIHFIMLIISAFVLYKTNISLGFFNDYVKTRQFIDSDTLINDTIPLTMVLLPFLLIGMSIMIFILFRKKDKPTLFYISSIMYYIAFIVVVVISRGIMTTIIFDGIDPRIARIVRDIWSIGYYLQFIIVGFYLIRTIGFDVKKFNFGEDIHELQISEEDSEEIELSTRFDRDKLKMKAAMQREEWKAFYYENRFMIIFILFILLIVMPGVFIARTIVANKRYTENEVIKLDNFEFKVLETYITKKDNSGDVLFKGNNSYLIVKFNINNLSETKRGLKLNNLRLEIDDNVYLPKTIYYDSFTDLGKGYIDQTISKESKDFIAVYVLNDSELKKNIVLRYTDSIKVKNNEASAIYYRININPKNIDEDIRKVTYNMGQELIIKNNNISFKIDESDIKEYYTYTLNNKTKYIVYTTGIVLCLNSESSIDLLKALKEFGSIKYTIDNRTYTENIVNITPSTYKGSNLYLGVREYIKDASSIELIFKSRTIEYIYKIK